ncbi:EnvZ/OmpR regulon moderator MzrA [Erwiniaceae bacterium BAC15a-03b]|uniref:Modulator protein MzrA n=1 Tax=Winslowiella arboricola TaxID=2978220 RepID=A0A9J6PJJ3_9GAMM|nr:EnvZ/OmpR regulon moderator MzrA [Winslowiella arboricola]MCU5771809.1 EnvZ/OmpR regulon moderator MzrA [Winslowiella arboricola]MCU5776659.1 EnvZ/OmpR regulon moderator MzrA [Winslowiella arboricola]
MMLQPKWIAARRRLMPWLMLSVLALLAVALMPAIYRQETALQIRASRQGTSLPDGFYVWQRLNAQGIQIKSITPDRDSLVIKFDSREQSIAAQKALREILPYGFEIAQMDSSSSKNWFSRISFNPQSVG